MIITFGLLFFDWEFTHFLNLIFFIGKHPKEQTYKKGEANQQ